MEEPLRLRVVFDDRKMLNKSQRSEGLKHCWLLLNPCIATISDLESHVRKTFHLKRSCPNGIVLYMDDFVLPPFESTCVLKDKDIIRVKKKDATGVDALELDDDPHHIQDSAVLDTKHTIDSKKILALTEFGEDSDQHNRKTDGDICVHEENAVHTGSPPSNSKKKRKHSGGILLPKAKKFKTPSLKSDIIGEDHGNIQNTDEVVGIMLGKSPGSSQKRGRSGRNSSKNDKPSSIDGSHGISVQLENNIEQVTDSLQREKRTKKLETPSLKSDITGEDHDNIQNTDEVVGIMLGKSPGSSQKRGRSGRNSRKNDKPSSINGSHSISAQLENNIEQVPDSLQREKRNAQVEENVGGNTCELHVNSCVRKVQSRNARRKKEKREWVREMRPLWCKNTPNQSPTAIHKESLEKQETEQDIEMEKEIVPVVIRPGHLRFQPLDEEQSPWQSQEAMETLQLNGTTSNNMGKKWHHVNNVSKWNDSNGYKEQFNEHEKIVRKWNDANGNRGPKCFRENLGSKWNNATGYKGQNWVRENAGRKWNDGNGYKGQKWGWENNGNKWNDANAFKGQSANGYREQFNGNQNTVSTWNDANGYKEQYNTNTGRWSDANGYKGQKWVRENTGSKWNNANGYNEQSVGNQKVMSTWNNANGYNEQSVGNGNGNQKVMSTWNNANGYNEQSVGNQKVMSTWNNANGYNEQSVVNQKVMSTWNNANGYNEQSVGNQKVMSTWNNANCYQKQCFSNADNWGDANGYNRQKWVRENVGRKWNGGDTHGCIGQKVIRENMQSGWNATNGYKEQSNGNEMMAKRWTDANGYEDPCISKTSNKWDPSNGHKELNNSVPGSLKAKAGSCPFECLFPLTRIPQVGDVLVYRLIELSPSWCPEVSPFRVGEVTSYNYLSMSIILVPVPEFPIFSDEDMERSDPTNKTKPSPYNEDGSLQIHYPSLVDVRLLKASDSVATSSDCSEKEMNTQAAAPVNKWELAIANTDAKETVSQPKETGNASSSTWDQIKLTINEKKAEMQQRKDGWDEWAPSRRNVGTSWSYQATRGRAMAPNLANMRGRNNKYQYRK